MGELTIQPTRPTAFGYGSFVLWLLSWVVGFVSPYLQVRFDVKHIVIIAYFQLLSAYRCVYPKTMFLVNRSTSDHMQWWSG